MIPRAFFILIGWCVALGGTTALDTLGSQAFTGGTPTDLSVHFQRGLVLLWLLFIPIAILWAHIRPVLMALGQTAELSENVQKYLTVLIIGGPAYIGFESLKKYLQCQGIMTYSTITLAFVFPVNIGLNIALVHFTPLKLVGSALALSLSYWLIFISLGLMTYFSHTHTSNGAWSWISIRRVLDPRGCMSFLKLALPGIVMVGTEWAAFEIVAIAAGNLGPLPLAAQSVIMTTDQILNTIPFGLGVAASARVGNLLGAQDPQGAKRAAHAAALVSVIAGTVIMIVLLATKDVFGVLFSSDPAVIHLVSRVMPLVASFQVADGLANSCGGVLRGQGRQHLGAVFNIVAYYVLALPMGISLAFLTDLKLQGLWIGQVVALFLVAMGEYAVVWKGTNWEKEVQKAVERNQEEAKHGSIGPSPAVAP